MKIFKKKSIAGVKSIIKKCFTNPYVQWNDEKIARIKDLDLDKLKDKELLYYFNLALMYIKDDDSDFIYNIAFDPCEQELVTLTADYNCTYSLKTSNNNKVDYNNFIERYMD